MHGMAPPERHALALSAIISAAVLVGASTSPVPPIEPGARIRGCAHAGTSAIRALRGMACRPAQAGPGDAPGACCRVLEVSLGRDSGALTGGCLCDRRAWTEVARAAELDGMCLGELLAACNTVHGTQIAWYRGEGAGECPDEAKALRTLQTVETKKMRSFAEWLADLPNQPAVLVSFLFSIPFGVGAIFFMSIASQALVV